MLYIDELLLFSILELAFFAPWCCPIPDIPSTCVVFASAPSENERHGGSSLNSCVFGLTVLLTLTPLRIATKANNSDDTHPCLVSIFEKELTGSRPTVGLMHQATRIPVILELGRASSDVEIMS